MCTSTCASAAARIWSPCRRLLSTLPLIIKCILRLFCASINLNYDSYWKFMQNYFYLTDIHVTWFNFCGFINWYLFCLNKYFTFHTAFLLFVSKMNCIHFSQKFYQASSQRRVYHYLETINVLTKQRYHFRQSFERIQTVCAHLPRRGHMARMHDVRQNCEEKRRSADSRGD